MDVPAVCITVCMPPPIYMSAHMHTQTSSYKKEHVYIIDNVNNSNDKTKNYKTSFASHWVKLCSEKSTFRV